MARGIAPIDSPVSLALREQAAQGLAQLERDAIADLAFDYIQMQVIAPQEAFVIVGATHREAAPAALQAL